MPYFSTDTKLYRKQEIPFLSTVVQGPVIGDLIKLGVQQVGYLMSCAFCHCMLRCSYTESSGEMPLCPNRADYSMFIFPRYAIFINFTSPLMIAHVAVPMHHAKTRF